MRLILFAWHSDCESSTKMNACVLTEFFLQSFFWCVHNIHFCWIAFRTRYEMCVYVRTNTRITSMLVLSCYNKCSHCLRWLSFCLHLIIRDNTNIVTMDENQCDLYHTIRKNSTNFTSHLITLLLFFFGKFNHKKNVDSLSENIAGSVEYLKRAVLMIF